MPTTIQHIADQAGVSAATVSLVLNGKTGISDATRSRVLRAASALNYRQKLPKIAKSKSLGTLRFLKIARHGHTVNRDHGSFIADYMDGMAGEAHRLGYKLEIASFEGTPMADIVASIEGTGLDGAIVLGTELSEADIQLVSAAAVPLVVMDTFCEFAECNMVNMGNSEAVFKIVSHFAQCGFKRIGFIASDVQTINFQLRKSAFVEGIKKLGLRLNPKDIVTVDSTYQGAYEEMLARLHGGLELPEGYFCCNDIMAYGCIKAFREFDIRIPEALSIIGFDNLPMSATMDPPLTTIDVSKQQIAYQAVRLLDEIIRSETKRPAMKILVGSSLVTRKSVIFKVHDSDA